MCSINFPSYCLILLIIEENTIFIKKSVHGLYMVGLEGLEIFLWQFNRYFKFLTFIDK